MKHEAALARKLRALQDRIVLIEALMAFLKKHPAVASRTIFWHLSNKVCLYFPDKAFIRTVWVDDKAALRLEKYEEKFWESDVSQRIVCEDISKLSRKELDKVLTKVRIDLSKTEAEDEETDEEDFLI